MNNIKDCENLSSKRVLLRLDLNVPLKNGDIVDETRIIKIIPVIEFLIKRNSKILIISHVGRPKGKFNKDLSLKPICDYLEKKIKNKINFISEDIFKISSSIKLILALIFFSKYSQIGLREKSLFTLPLGRPT